MRRLHAQLPHAVVGGAIECAPGDLLNWSFYVCDFSRYGLPFAAGPRDWVSDVNVCYKRRAVEATREVWAERFSEPQVHWFLKARGETLFLSPEPVVVYRTPYRSLLGVLPERFHWGRLFGCIRARHSSAAARIARALLGPLIPLRLFARHALAQTRRGRGLRYLAAAPIVLALLCAWTAGEVWGDITGEP
jgi:hypothetical protein